MGRPLPTWVTVVVILTVLGLLVFSVVVLREGGYGITVVLCGLLGAYGGLRELVNRKRNGDGE